MPLTPSSPLPPHIREFFERTEGMISLEEAGALFALAKDVSRGCIVEVGSYRGQSTAMLGYGSLEGGRVPVFAIEPHEEFTGVLGGKFGPPDRCAFFKAMIDSGAYQIVRLVNLSSEYVTPRWDKPVGLLWLDGDHTYQGVKRDFDCWCPHLLPDGIVAFHDSIDPALGPCRLIKEILAGGPWEILARVGAMTVIGRKKV